MRWRPACWQRHVDAHPARSMTMLTLLPAPSRGVRGVHRSVRMGGAAHIVAHSLAHHKQLPARRRLCVRGAQRVLVLRVRCRAAPTTAGTQRREVSAGTAAAARAARRCPPPHRARSGRGVEKRPGCVHRRCVKKGYKLWGRRPSVSTVQPLGHYYPRAITHTRAGASVDTQHRIAVHFITPTPNTHTNLEVLPWVMVSPEYRRAAVHMRTRAQLDTRSAAAATSHHTHRAGLPNAERPSVSQYVSDGRDCRLTTHMHMRSPAERRGGEGASARATHTRLQRRTDANG